VDQWPHNGNLLSILRKLCAPGLGEDDYEKMQWKDLPKNWPLYFDEAIRLLNRRLIPSLKCSPAELMLGLVINTNPTPTKNSILPTEAEHVGIHQAYVQQQRLDGYAHTMEHAERRKNAFNKRVLAQSPGVVTFKKGQLIQVYRNDLTYTFKAERKLLPRWSAPQRIVSRDRNSYRLETLEGVPMESTFSSRRLRRFMPRAGTQLAKKQEELEKRLREAVALGETADEEMENEEEDEEEDVLDVGNGVDGGEDVSEEETQPQTEADIEADGQEDENVIVGNGLVEEVAEEVEGSWTRRGRRYDGGGHL
jgi:hypothetical protein